MVRKIHLVHLVVKIFFVSVFVRVDNIGRLSTHTAILRSLGGFEDFL